MSLLGLLLACVTTEPVTPPGTDLDEDGWTVELGDCDAAVPGDWICLATGDHTAAVVDRPLTITGLQRASETRILGDGGPALIVKRVDGLTLEPRRAAA